MTNAQKGDLVTLHYTGKLEDGRVFDSSVDKDPVQFKIGASQIIPGLERAVIGMTPGETKTVQLQPDDAYGHRDDNLIHVITRDRFPANIQPQIGQQLEVRDQQGQKRIAVVADVNQQGVTLDSNHPLAGRNLTFDIQLVEIA